MKVVFADTSYWIALINPREALHAKATALARKFASHRVVTSEMVCVELLNSFSSAGTHLRGAAVALVVALRQSRSGLVWPQTRNNFRKPCSGTRKCKTRTGVSPIAQVSRSWILKEFVKRSPVTGTLPRPGFLCCWLRGGDAL